MQARPKRSFLWNRYECVCVHVKGLWENGWLSNSHSLTKPLQPFSHFHTNCFQITQTLPVSQSKPTSAHICPTDWCSFSLRTLSGTCLSWQILTMTHTQTRSARNPAQLRMQGLGRVAPNVCMFFLKMGHSQQLLVFCKYLSGKFGCIGCF